MKIAKLTCNLFLSLLIELVELKLQLAISESLLN